MGMVKVETAGSFKPRRSTVFSAMHGGHARAVAEAIEFLASVVLPEAIRLDHELHGQGKKPLGGFGETVHQE